MQTNASKIIVLDFALILVCLSFPRKYCKCHWLLVRISSIDFPHLLQVQCRAPILLSVTGGCRLSPKPAVKSKESGWDSQW